jgi:hypothetical protein
MTETKTPDKIQPGLHWYSYFSFRFTQPQIFWALQEWIYFEGNRWPPEPQVDPKNNEDGEYLTDVLIDAVDKKGILLLKNGKPYKVWVEQIRVGLSVASGAEAHQVTSEGHFVKPCVITAEIKKRLARTKDDGKTLMQEFERLHPRTIYELADAAKFALIYIASGEKPRQQTYAQWKATQDNRRKLQ